MVTKLLTSNFKTWAARLFVRSFKPASTTTEFTTTTAFRADFIRYVTLGYVNFPNNPYSVEIMDTAASIGDIYIPDVSTYYVFAGNSTIKTTTIANNPCVNTSVYGSQYNIYDGMVFGKRAGPDDVSLMIARNEWAAGTTYDFYDDTDPLLFQKPFFVSVLEGGDYHVFKCIDNNNGAPSTFKPSPTLSTSPPPSSIVLSGISTDYYYQTADGYVWMYLYSIPIVTYQKFATSGYIPLPVRFSSNPPKAGSIETMVVVDSGAYYQHVLGSLVTTPNDSKTFYISPTGAADRDLFVIPNFYQDYALYNMSEIRRITSSGIDSLGRKFVTIDSTFTFALADQSQFEIFPYVQITDAAGQNAAARPEMLDNGSISNIVMVNTGADYSNTTVTVLGKTGYYNGTINPVFIYTSSSATVRAIISPPMGHGRDLVNELFADKVCVSVDFIKDEHPLTSYTEYGLMLDPIFKEITLNYDPLITTKTLANDILVQIQTGAYGTVKSIGGGVIVLSNVIGVFQFDVPMTSYFTKEVLMPLKPTPPPTINTIQDKFVYSEIVDNSGEILLIRDDVVTTRTATQTERIKLLVDF